MSENSQYFKEITDVSNNESVRDDAEFLIVQTPNGGTGKELVRLNLADIAAALQDIIGSGGGTMPALTIKGNDTNDTRAAKNLTKADVLAMFAMQGASAEESKSGMRSDPSYTTLDLDDAIHRYIGAGAGDDGRTGGYIDRNGAGNISALYSTYIFAVAGGDMLISAKVRVKATNIAYVGFLKEIDLSQLTLANALSNAPANNIRYLGDKASGVHYGEIYDYPVSQAQEQELTVQAGENYVFITTWMGELAEGDAGYNANYYSAPITPEIELHVTSADEGGDEGGDDDDTPSEGRTDGTAGFVPAPKANEIGKFLRGDGTWATPAGGGGGTDYSGDISDLQDDVADLQDDVEDIQDDIAALYADIYGQKSPVKAVYTRCMTRQTGAPPYASTSKSNILTDNDIVFVGDELWLSKDETMASPAPTGALTNERRDIRRMKLVDGVWTQIDSALRTDFGHWNSVDYCPETDCLVFGNGGNDPSFSQTTGNWFAVIKNPKSMWTGYEYTTGYALLKDFAIKYNWEDEETKVNAVWGSSNLGKNDIVYVHSVVSGGASIITKVQLATDSNGDFAYETVTENGITVKRGSYIVLGKVTNAQYVGAGGMDFHGDTLYIGNGVERGFALMSISDYNTKFVKTPYYPAYNGTDQTVAISGCTQGIVVDNDYIWMYSNDARTTTGNGFLVQYYNCGFGNSAPSSDVGASPAPSQVTVTTAGAVTQELAPNTVYVFTGELTSLTLTLGTPISGIANLYQAFFFNGSTAVNLTLPSGVDIGDFVPEADKLSEINIQYIGPLGQTGTQRAEYILRGDNR